MEILELFPAAWFSLLGGLFIAIACTLNLYFTGRITGMSSIFYTIINWNTNEGLLWKLMFLGGLLTPSYIFFQVIKDEVHNKRQFYNQGWLNHYLLIVGGILVGLGTKIGNGCTSGHAVCGIARLSLRSIVATCLFVCFGLAAGTAAHYVGPFNSIGWGDDYKDKIFPWISYALLGIVGSTIVIMAVKSYLQKPEGKTILEILLSYIVGVLFGAGLAVSGMCNPANIVNFLTIRDGWDLALMFIMISAIGVNLVTFQLILRSYETPVLLGKFPELNKNLDLPVIIGPIIFGIGWGISGLCPGPGMIGLFILPQGFVYLFALACGQLLAGKVILPLIAPSPSTTPATQQSLTK